MANLTNDLKYKEIWSFKYKGFTCEIVNWGKNERVSSVMDAPTGVWNSYIYILKQQLPKDFKKLLCRSHASTLTSKRRFFDYYKLDGYFNMHGGLTFYEPLRDDFTGKKIGVKVGNDYLHYGDEGYSYNVDWVKRDLEKSVDTFIEQFPNYLVWRISDGKYVKPGIEETK